MTLSAFLPPGAGRASIGPSLAGTRVLVVSGSYGAGHDAAAHEIALRLRAEDCVVEVQDVVDMLPLRVGRALRSVYLAQLRRSPASWDLTLRRLQPGTRLHVLTTHFLALAGPNLLRAAEGAHLVVSTHPFASQALGRLRGTGVLRSPVVTYLTDASVHPLWVHPGVDLHLALHDVAAEQARRWGGRTTVVRPLVPARPMRPLRTRAELGLPEGRPLALVVGGSLGIGDLEQAALDLLDTGRVTPVVVTGRNHGLRERLSARPGVVALGWRDDLADVLAVSSVVVQNAGGFMSLEAMASGVPVLTYRPIPGHGRTNAEALERAGLVPFVRDDAGLGPALARALVAVRVARLPDMAPDLVEALAGSCLLAVARVGAAS